MYFKQIKVDRAIKKITSKDNLFHGNYTVDPYQNCDFGCIYCDSSYSETVFIKTNIVEIFEKELEKLPRGIVIVGSVHDPYQKSEKDCFLTRKILEIIQIYNFSCHILTKSDLVLRDIDILKNIKDCIVTVSITNLNDNNLKSFEKNVPSPKKRFEVVEELNKYGIKSGIAIIPLIPFIGDNKIGKIFEEAKKHNSKYVLYKYLELKGDQKNIFFDYIRNKYPDLSEKFIQLYKDSFKPTKSFIKSLNDSMHKFSKIYKIRTMI